MEPDDLDGCGAMLAATEHDDALTATLRPLFPRGQADADLADDWLGLFGDCGLPEVEG